MTIVIKARKILANKVLNRRQMIIEVVHAGLANVKKSELAEKLATKLKTNA
jgi:small subunit ribosomal protein S24e